MKNTISKEELASLQEAHTKHSSLRQSLADTAIMASRFQNQQTQLVSKILEAEQELAKIEADLKAKYNLAKVNAATGEYSTEIEEVK